MLTDAEQGLLRRLAVFADGCTLEAAEQVTRADLDLLQSLVDKSLLRRTGERYWMLETIREYAGEQLQADSDDADVRRDHTSYYLSLCEAFAIAHREADPDAMRLMSRCDAEQDNLRAALAWSAEADHATLMRLVMAAHHLWMGRAPVEGDRWTELARARCPSEDRPLRARLLSLASNFAEDRGHLERVLALREDALALYRGLGDELSTAGTLRLIATILLPLGRLEEARARQDEALELARQLGDERALTLALVDEGICLAWEGHFSEALAVQQDVLDRLRALDWHPYLLGQLTLMGTMWLHQGELERAQDCFKEILENWAREPPQAWGAAAEELLALAAISAREGRMIQAARLLASGERGLRESGRVIWVLTPWLEEAHSEARSAVTTRLEAEELAKIERDIETMSRGEAIDEAISTLAYSSGSTEAASAAPPATIWGSKREDGYCDGSSSTSPTS